MRSKSHLFVLFFNAFCFNKRLLLCVFYSVFKGLMEQLLLLEGKVVYNILVAEKEFSIEPFANIACKFAFRFFDE